MANKKQRSNQPRVGSNVDNEYDYHYAVEVAGQKPSNPKEKAIQKRAEAEARNFERRNPGKSERGNVSKSNPKKPKGIYSKGEGASNFTPNSYSKTGSEKFNDVVSAAVDTTETKKDRANLNSIISAAGRKYKVDQKVVDKTIKAVQGTQKGHTVTKVNRKSGRSE